MAVHPLRSATDRCLGGLLPLQLANRTRIHLSPISLSLSYHAIRKAYAVLAAVSSCYPPVKGRLSTRYSPVRHSVKCFCFRFHSCFVRLACVRHAASVHPEPGSNSHLLVFLFSELPASNFLFTVFGLFLFIETFA